MSVKGVLNLLYKEPLTLFEHWIRSPGPQPSLPPFSTISEEDLVPSEADQAVSLGSEMTHPYYGISLQLAFA